MNMITNYFQLSISVAFVMIGASKVVGLNARKWLIGFSLGALSS
jgi:hypothetical protein